MEIPKIIYEKDLKSKDNAIKLKKALEKEFLKSKKALGNDFPKEPTLPLLITEKQHKEIKKASNTFGKIINKTVKLIIEKKISGKYLRMYKTIWNFIKKEEKKETSGITFSRLNGVFDSSGQIKFFECTAEPGSLLLGQELQDIYKKITPLNEMFKKNNITFHNNSKSNLTRFFNKYTKETNFIKSKDNIAIIKPETGFGYRLYEKYLQDKGYNVFTIAPEELEFENNCIIAGNKKIDLVIISEKLNRAITKKLRQVFNIYTEGKIRLLDYIQSAIATEKSLMALMSDPKNHKFYNNSEISFIKKHIPWTRIIRHENTTDMEGNKIDLIEYIVKNQEKLVLKKSSSFMGGQVGPAYDMNRLDWKTLITWILVDKEYWIAQEKVDFNSSERYVLDNNEINLKKFYWCINPFLLNGKYQTCYAMTSTEPVVNTETSKIETITGLV